MIPYGHHDITQADIDAVVEVLRSDFLTQGPVELHEYRDRRVIQACPSALTHSERSRS